MVSPNVPIIDGLFFMSDGDPTEAIEGGINAINLTVVNPLADLTQSIDELAVWCKRLSQPGAKWRLVRSTDDITKARDAQQLGLVMGWQNMLPIGDRLERLWLFHGLGVRVMQLTYNTATIVGDGCLEPRKAGLSTFGRSVVAEMNEVGLAIDLSHCSERVALDVSEVTTKPVLVTHANASSVFVQPRNKSDEVIRAVAGTGGVIGLSIHGFMNWNSNPAEPPSLDGFVANVKYVSDLVGIDHIGIGTDFAVLGRKSAANSFLNMSKEQFAGTSGAFISAFGNQLDSRYPKETPGPKHYPKIFSALSRNGFSDADIGKIGGGNFMRTFQAIWGS